MIFFSIISNSLLSILKPFFHNSVAIDVVVMAGGVTAVVAAALVCNGFCCLAKFCNIRPRMRMRHKLDLWPSVLLGVHRIILYILEPPRFHNFHLHAPTLLPAAAANVAAVADVAAAFPAAALLLLPPAAAALVAVPYVHGI